MPLMSATDARQLLELSALKLAAHENKINEQIIAACEAGQRQILVDGFIEVHNQFEPKPKATALITKLIEILTAKGYRAEWKAAFPYTTNQGFGSLDDDGKLSTNYRIVVNW